MTTAIDGLLVPVSGSNPLPRRSIGASYERTLKRLTRIGIPGTPNDRIVRMITLLAALAAVTIAAIVPISWFMAAQSRLRGELEIHARIYASEVADEARQNPALWNA